MRVPVPVIDVSQISAKWADSQVPDRSQLVSASISDAHLEGVHICLRTIKIPVTSLTKRILYMLLFKCFYANTYKIRLIEIEGSDWIPLIVLGYLI